MIREKSFKTGKALLFITSGLLFSDTCFAAAPNRMWTWDPDDPTNRGIAPHSIRRRQEALRRQQEAAAAADGSRPNPAATAAQPSQPSQFIRPRLNQDNTCVLEARQNPWTQEMDNQLTNFFLLYGTDWGEIASQINISNQTIEMGVTSEECRNRWNILRARTLPVPTRTFPTQDEE
jgi:hypothetical protein